MRTGQQWSTALSPHEELKKQRRRNQQVKVDSKPVRLFDQQIGVSCCFSCPLYPLLTANLLGQARGIRLQHQPHPATQQPPCSGAPLSLTLHQVGGHNTPRTPAKTMGKHEAGTATSPSSRRGPSPREAPSLPALQVGSRLSLGVGMAQAGPLARTASMPHATPGDDVLSTEAFFHTPQSRGRTDEMVLHAAGGEQPVGKEWRGSSDQGEGARDGDRATHTNTRSAWIFEAQRPCDTGFCVPPHDEGRRRVSGDRQLLVIMFGVPVAFRHAERSVDAVAGSGYSRKPRLEGLPFVVSRAA